MQPITFEFNEMATLAKENPDMFAQRRDELIRGFIEGSKHSQDMNALQMHLDSVRYCSAPGIGSTQEMFCAMTDSMKALTVALNRLDQAIKAKV